MKNEWTIVGLLSEDGPVMIAFGNQFAKADTTTLKPHEYRIQTAECYSASMNETFYESNDKEPIGAQSGSEYADSQAMACRSVYPKPIGIPATKETTSQTAASGGTNNQ